MYASSMVMPGAFIDHRAAVQEPSARVRATTAGRGACSTIRYCGISSLAYSPISGSRAGAPAARQAASG